MNCTNASSADITWERFCLSNKVVILELSLSVFFEFL